MKNKRYKILVLSDLNSATGNILKSAISLAKIIHGEIEILYIGKPTEIVGNDNQLSAMRTINTEHTVTDGKFKELITPISETYGMDIKYKFIIGNVKNEIDNYIKEYRPDILVLGMRKQRPLNLIGDSITAFVLNTFDGAILISSDKHGLEPGERLSIGVLNGLEQSFKMEFAEELMAHVRKPIKSFKFTKNSEVSKNENVSSQDKEIIEYVFEYNDSSINSLSKYLSKSNIDLLFLNRESKDSGNEKNLMMLDIKTIINKVNVSLLVYG